MNRSPLPCHPIFDVIGCRSFRNAELEAEIACTAQLRAELEDWRVDGDATLEKLARIDVASTLRPLRRFSRSDPS